MMKMPTDTAPKAVTRGVPKSPSFQRRVRHDVADSLAVMGFSLAASVTVAVLIALATNVEW